MTLSRLHDGPSAAMAPKVANLARAAAAGLPVPEGVVLPLDQVEHLVNDEALLELWTRGSTMVRSALRFEDGALHSGAGLGVSIAGVRDVPGLLAAVAEIRAARRAGVPGQDFGGADEVLVQHQVAAVARVVVGCEPTRDYVEQYGGSVEAFADGGTPDFSGPLGSWSSRWAPATRAILEHVRAEMEPTAYGLDVELVIDADDVVHLVQVRPLTAPLHPGWAEFVDTARRAGDEIPATGSLVLDVEHNPEPLSFAHAWLVRWLARERPRTGGLVPIAGWLYTRVLIRDLASHATRDSAGPRAVVERLQREYLPSARARHTTIAGRCAAATAPEIDRLFVAALDAFLTMIDVYFDELIPARRQHGSLAPDLGDPFCLRGRDDVLDVLPIAWDVAAPTLGPRRETSTAIVAIPDDEAGAATLLREWDDHLFALGLAPLRAVYRRVGELTGLDDDVFSLTPPECLVALNGHDVTELVRTRAEARGQAATLSPPGRIFAGQPGGVPPQWLRGIPIGPPAAGPVARRRDLLDLRDRPPAPGCIVVLPALTAPAAVVLHELGLRAICCEHGGAMSHAALMARELKLSALLGCRGCTSIPDRTEVELDTRRGVLRRRLA